MVISQYPVQMFEKPNKILSTDEIIYEQNESSQSI